MIRDRDEVRQFRERQRKRIVWCPHCERALEHHDYQVILRLGLWKPVCSFCHKQADVATDIVTAMGRLEETKKKEQKGA